MSGLFEELVEDVEELFPAKPGGMVDRHRKKMAAEAAAQAEREHEQEKVEQHAIKAVKTAQESPEVFSAQTYTIAAGGSAMILPNSPYRYRATVSLLTGSSATVVLAKDQGAAIGGNGFTVGTQYALVVLYSRAQVWAYNPGGSPISVSVMADIYSPE